MEKYPNGSSPTAQGHQAAPSTAASREYLILSKSHTNGVAMWWRPGEAGYTTDVDKAGRYSAEDSDRIVRGSPDKDVRIPASAIGDAIVTRRIVDVGDAFNHVELASFEGV